MGWFLFKSVLVLGFTFLFKSFKFAVITEILTLFILFCLNSTKFESISDPSNDESTFLTT